MSVLAVTAGPDGRPCFSLEAPDHPFSVHRLDDLRPDSGSSVTAIELRVSEAGLQQALGTVAAVLIGIPPRAAQRLHPAAQLLLSASIDVNGAEKTPLSEASVRTGLAGLAELAAGRTLRAVVVSGMNSHRNPAHEQRCAALSHEVTGLPAVEARYWGDAFSSVERARRAIRGTAAALVCADLLPAARQAQAAIGGSTIIRAPALDASLFAALSHCAALSHLAPLAAGESRAAPIVQARVARSENGYACHCSDGLFEFDSIVAAKAFAASHLRDQLADHARCLGLEERPVQIDSQDRYTQVRGKRGPVRVYLETLITARRQE